MKSPRWKNRSASYQKEEAFIKSRSGLFLQHRRAARSVCVCDIIGTHTVAAASPVLGAPPFASLGPTGNKSKTLERIKLAAQQTARNLSHCVEEGEEDS